MDVLAAAAADAATGADEEPGAAEEPRSPPPPPPRAQRLSTRERWACVNLHSDGRSQRYIAEHLRVHRATVAATLARYRATGDVGSGSRSGRPRTLPARASSAIVAASQRDPFLSPRRLRTDLALPVSPRTVDRRLQEAGLFGRVGVRKRDYTPAERQKRLAFANGYQAWTEEQWESVLFSDEKTFYGRGYCGRVWVRRPIGAALQPEYVVHKQAHPIKVGAWACFCAKGPGYLRMSMTPWTVR